MQRVGRDMPIHALTKVLAARLEDMAQSGRLKGKESVIRGVMSARGDRGPVVRVEQVEQVADQIFVRHNLTRLARLRESITQAGAAFPIPAYGPNPVPRHSSPG